MIRKKFYRMSFNVKVVKSLQAKQAANAKKSDMSINAGDDLVS